jgi:hypothetical protein
MTGNGAILNFGWTLPNRDAIHDGWVSAWMGTRPAHEAPAAQMTQQLLLQDVARLNEETPVDRLVGHPHKVIMREGMLQANGDLARRPIEPQVLGDPVPKPRPSGKEALLRSACAIPSPAIGFAGTVTLPATIAAHLATDR